MDEYDENPYASSGDYGNIDLSAGIEHAHGHGVAGQVSVGGRGMATPGHTMLILFGALVLLWVLGFSFKNVRI